MNKLKKIKYQYIINNYLKNNDIKAISDLIYNMGPEIYECLTIKEINALIELALKYQDNSFLLNHLLIYCNNIDIKKIINNISILKLNHQIYTKYLPDLISIALKENKKSLILHLARFLSENKGNYSSEISLIKDYLLNNEVNYITTSITPLKGFYDANLENKIITSEVKYVSDYLVKAPNKNNFFQKYYLTKPPKEDLKKIIHKFSHSHNKINNEIYEYIVETITKKDIEDPKLQSNYLLTLYEEDKDYPKIDIIIYSLINLNVPNLIKELMQDLTEEKQNIICESYLENNKYYKTLAITTNCKNTYKFIDKVIEKDNLLDIVDLIGNLEGKFLDYTLDKIIKEKESKYYLTIINKLYLLGYANCLKTINFIFIYKFTNLFSLNTLQKLNFYQNQTLKRTRKM